MLISITHKKGKNMAISGSDKNLWKKNRPNCLNRSKTYDRPHTCRCDIVTIVHALCGKFVKFEISYMPTTFFANYLKRSQWLDSCNCL